MPQQSLTLPATGTGAGSAAGTAKAKRNRRLLELAGAAAIAATYLFLVLTQPADIANGPASFAYTVTDTGDPVGTAGNALSASATVGVTVLSVNDAPQGASKTVVTPEDAGYAFGVADFGLTDPSDSPANALKAVKVTASARIATTSARVRGSKLERKVPGVAMSRSAWVSYPRWIASSRRWKSRFSQFSTSL